MYIKKGSTFLDTTLVIIEFITVFSKHYIIVSYMIKSNIIKTSYLPQPKKQCPSLLYLSLKEKKKDASSAALSSESDP